MHKKDIVASLFSLMRINLTSQSLKQLLPATVINQLRQLPIWNLVIKVKFKHKRHSCQTHQFHYLTNTISWVCHEHCKGPSIQTFCIRDVRWTFLVSSIVQNTGDVCFFSHFDFYLFIYLIFQAIFSCCIFFIYFIIFFFISLFQSVSSGGSGGWGGAFNFAVIFLIPYAR